MNIHKKYVIIKHLNIDFLLNKKIKNITLLKGCVDDVVEILFELEDTQKVCMYHEQDCCEYVYVEDIAGDINRLIGNTLVMAEEVTNRKYIEEVAEHELSCTWTFYKLADDKGNYVTIRWYGSSNGYYSESVDLALVEYRN